MTRPAPQTRARYGNLDVLRIALALEVVVLHTSPLWRPDGSWAMPIDAVTAFICLSGFLIPGSFGSSRSAAHFAWKRFLRVVPAMVLSFYLVAVLFGPAAVRPTFLFYITVGIVPFASMNGVLWTLALEEILYSMHAASRVLLRAWRPEIVILLLIACLLLGGSIQAADTARIFLTASGFFAGNLAYFARQRLLRLSPIYYAATMAVIFIRPDLLGRFAVPALPLATVLLACTLPQIRFRVPDVSYGIYLYHFPFLNYWLRNFGWSPATVALTFVSAIALATASWYLVESRALRLKDWRPAGVSAAWPGPRSVLPAARATAAIVALLATVALLPYAAPRAYAASVDALGSLGPGRPSVASAATAGSLAAPRPAQDAVPALFGIDSVDDLAAPPAGATVAVDPRLFNVTIAGWAVDSGAHLPASGVVVDIDDKSGVHATYGLSRPDVAAAFKTPAYGTSGFRASIPAASLGKGRHQLSLKIISADGSTYSRPDYYVVLDIR